MAWQTKALPLAEGGQGKITVSGKGDAGASITIKVYKSPKVAGASPVKTVSGTLDGTNQSTAIPMDPGTYLVEVTVGNEAPHETDDVTVTS